MATKKERNEIKEIVEAIKNKGVEEREEAYDAYKERYKDIVKKSEYADVIDNVMQNKAYELFEKFREELTSALDDILTNPSKYPEIKKVMEKEKGTELSFLHDKVDETFCYDVENMLDDVTFDFKAKKRFGSIYRSGTRDIIEDFVEFDYSQGKRDFDIEETSVRRR